MRWLIALLAALAWLFAGLNFAWSATTWSAKASLATERGYHTATLLPSGQVMATGGSNNASNLASVELYAPATNTWSAAGALVSARGSHTATLLSSGQVLVSGGGSNGSV